MPKEEPIDEALQQIKALISVLQDNFFRMVDTGETIKAEKEIMELEKEVDKFITDTNKVLKEFGLSDMQNRKLEDGMLPENLSGEAQETLSVAQNLKEQIFELQKKAQEQQMPTTEGKGKKSNQSKSTKLQHKKKYKRLGGSEHWKPL